VPTPLHTLSLIVSTKGRSNELHRLFQSLNVQTFRDFEVILVEQNENRMLDDVLNQRWTFPTVYHHTPTQRGTSRGRNQGLYLSNADFVLFPDDDCWYPPAFLENGINE
jgi:glycosyltransferase involved in cell wall biosynthesis